MVCYRVVLERLERYLHVVIISTTKLSKMFEYLVESFGSHRIVTKHSIQSAGLGLNTIQYQSNLVYS